MTEPEATLGQNPKEAAMLQLFKEKVEPKLAQIEKESQTQDSVIKKLQAEIDDLIKVGTAINKELDEAEDQDKDGATSARRGGRDMKIDVDDETGNNVKAPQSTREVKTGLMGDKDSAKDPKNRRLSHQGKIDKPPSLTNVDDQKKDAKGGKKPTPATRPGKTENKTENKTVGEKKGPGAKDKAKDGEEEKKDESQEPVEKTPEQIAADECKNLLNDLTKKEISEVASYAKPPAPINKVFEAVLLALGEKTYTWANAQKLAKGADFTKKLGDVKVNSISSDNFKKIRQFLGEDVHKAETIGNTSAAAKHLVNWLEGLVKVRDISKPGEAQEHADAIAADNAKKEEEEKKKAEKKEEDKKKAEEKEKAKDEKKPGVPKTPAPKTTKADGVKDDKKTTTKKEEKKDEKEDKEKDEKKPGVPKTPAPKTTKADATKDDKKAAPAEAEVKKPDLVNSHPDLKEEKPAEEEKPKEVEHKEEPKAEKAVEEKPVEEKPQEVEHKEEPKAEVNTHVEEPKKEEHVEQNNTHHAQEEQKEVEKPEEKAPEVHEEKINHETHENNVESKTVGEHNGNGDVLHHKDNAEIVGELTSVLGHDVSGEVQNGNLNEVVNKKIKEADTQLRAVENQIDEFRKDSVSESAEKKPYEIKQSTKEFIQMVQQEWVSELKSNPDWDEKIYQILALLFLTQGNQDVPDVKDHAKLRAYAIEKLEKEEADLGGYLMSLEKNLNLDIASKIRIQEFLRDKNAILNPSTFDGVDALCGVISFLMKEACEYLGVIPIELAKKAAAKEKILALNLEKNDYLLEKKGKLIEIANKHGIPVNE